MLLNLGLRGKTFLPVKFNGRDNNGHVYCIVMPVITVVGDKGQTVLVVGGTHGDEYEGQLVSIDLARDLDAAGLKGRLVIVPFLNVPASEAGQRHSPLDGRDLNRTYPGHAGGTISDVVADFVVSRLLPEADFVIDLHSGGSWSEYVPCAMMMQTGIRTLDRAMLAAIEAFGAPFGIIFRDTGNPGSMETQGTLEHAAHHRGIGAISTELGGGGYVTPRTLAIGRQGIRNLLTHLGLTKNCALNGTVSRMMECTKPAQYVISPDDGLWEPLVQLGDPVEHGSPVCRLFDTKDPMKTPQTLCSQSDGVVVARRVPARCRQNDFLIITACDLSV